MSLLKTKFESGLSIEEYEAKLGDNLDLHRHHFAKNDVSSAVGEYKDRIQPTKILIITEPWCGDSLAVVPTLLKFFGNFPQVEIRFVLRDENIDIMEQYLTNGGQAIPRIIVMREDFSEIFNFGPRPQAAQQIFEDHRQMIADGEIEKMDVIKKIRAFYARDRGKKVIAEFLQKMFA
jgi:hypothetical protein